MISILTVGDRAVGTAFIPVHSILQEDRLAETTLTEHNENTEEPANNSFDMILNCHVLSISFLCP